MRQPIIKMFAQQTKKPRNGFEDWPRKAEKALDAVDETLAANLPDRTYQTKYQEASRAVIAVVENVRTIEEGVFATELQKPLLARLMKVGTAVNQETFRRTDAEVKRVNEKARRKK